MPKIVDKVLRREEILDAYIRLVQREGMAAATTRMLARECKMAVGGLWGYFDSFENLRVAAFERAFIAAGQMLMEDSLGKRGLIGLASTLKHIMPIRDESSTEAQLFTAFLESEPREQIYAVQIRMEALWKDSLMFHMREAQDDNQIRPDVKLDGLADVVLSLVIGLQMEYIMLSPRGSPQRQWEIIDFCLSPWLVGDHRLPHFQSV